MNSYKLVGVTCTLAASFIFSSQKLVRALCSCPVTTFEQLARGSNLSCVLPFELATPPGLQVNHNPEGESCTFTYLSPSLRLKIVHVASC